MLVADMGGEIVLRDHFAHVAEDFLGRRDRCAGPGLETIAERVQVAVGPDAGVFVGQPCAPETRQFQDDEACSGALRRQMIGATDAGDTGARDQDVEVLGLHRRRRGHHGCIVHGQSPTGWSNGGAVKACPISYHSVA